MSIIQIILLFYLLIASNYTDGLLSKNMKNFIEENRLAQHFIGLMLMFVLIVTIGNYDLDESIVYAIIGYLWFIMSTKLDIQFNIMLLVLMLLAFLYERKMSKMNEQIKNDNTIENKNKLIAENNKYNKWFIISGLVITLVGGTLYCDRKVVQYGGGFNVVQYLFY